MQQQTHLFIVNAHKEKEACIPPVYNLHIPVFCEGALQMQACTSQSPDDMYLYFETDSCLHVHHGLSNGSTCQSAKVVSDLLLRSCKTFPHNFPLKCSPLFHGQALVCVLGQSCLTLLVDEQDKFDSHVLTSNVLLHRIFCDYLSITNAQDGITNASDLHVCFAWALLCVE